MASEENFSKFYHRFSKIILSAILLANAVGQRTGFKIAGATLGRRPFLMVMLSVLGSVPINSVAYAYMVYRTGGVLPEFRTWRYFRDYWVIATLNIFNGLGIMWANPFVPGHTQALISSMAIPLTMIMTTICFGTHYSFAAITGVVFIIGGVLRASLGDTISSDAAVSTAGSMLWTAIFVTSQLPLSAASVYQEFAFKKSLNMLHYVHYVTVFLLVDLVVCIPLDTTSFGDSSSLADFFSTSHEYLNCVLGLGGPPDCEGAGQALLCYIVCMNINTFVQALLIKSAGATWSMVVVSLGTPLGALAFACPWIVGAEHVEEIGPGIYLATVLVTVGVLVYRLGSVSSASNDEAQEEEGKTLGAEHKGYVPLEDCDVSSNSLARDIAIQTDIVVGSQHVQAAQLLEAFLKCEGYGPPRPAVVAAGVGLFSSEYTNASGNPLSLFEEKTFADIRARGRSGSPQRSRATKPPRAASEELVKRGRQLS